MEPSIWKVVDEPGEFEPEVRLWRAVVLQAVTDAMDPQFKQETLEWMTSEDFATVCEQAGLTPHKVGRMLAQVVLRPKPHNIVAAQKLKNAIFHCTIDVI